MNGAAAQLLCQKFLPITYQVDIQMCVFTRQYSIFHFYNCADAGTNQCSAFISQTRYYHPSFEEIGSLLPEFMAILVYSFLDIHDRPMTNPNNISYYS
jgi:hypothetical protein